MTEEIKIKRTPFVGEIIEDRPDCMAPPAIAESCRCFVGAGFPDKEKVDPEGCLQVFGFCLFQKERKLMIKVR
jgi:hypothetical protein